MPEVVPFEAVYRTDVPLAGGKRANLGELVRAGIPVPPGFIVTTGAYRACLDAINACDKSTLASSIGASSRSSKNSSIRKPATTRLTPTSGARFARRRGAGGQANLRFTTTPT